MFPYSFLQGVHLEKIMKRSFQKMPISNLPGILISFWYLYWYLFMDVGRITKRAKKVKGGGSRQQINRRGVGVMVIY